MNIRIGVVGRIEQGDETGFYVKVVDDSSNTGGYLVLTSKNPDMSDGFDNWVEDGKSLSRFFEESRWVVAWLPNDPP